MMMHKAFRFRIYPDDHACQTLAGWFGCVRLVGNLAKEQRRMFSRKDRNITYAMQCAELPAMRAEFQWMKECPNQILQQKLKDVNRAYSNFFEGLTAYPRPQTKYEGDSCRFPALEQRQVLKQDGKPLLDENGEPLWKTHTVVELGDEYIDLPKIGRIRWVRHRPIEGKPLSVTISRDGAMYFASILCEFEPDPAKVPPPVQQTTSFDYNAQRRKNYAMPDGRFFEVPGEAEGEARRRKSLETKIARRNDARKGKEKEMKKEGTLEDGEHLPQSSRERKARNALRDLDGRVKRRKRDALHKFTTGEVRRAALIGYEDLDIKAMTASAKGTVEKPGKRVVQKSGLNKSMLHGCPGEGRRQVEYKAKWMGRQAVAVPPAHTSQYCSECHRHPKDDPATSHLQHGRKDDNFTCPLCGFSCDADTNASRNIEWEACRIAALDGSARPRTRREKRRDKRLASLSPKRRDKK